MNFAISFTIVFQLQKKKNGVNQQSQENIWSLSPE